MAPFAFCTVSSSWTSSSSGRDTSNTYWNSKNAVPIVIAPFVTSTALSTRLRIRPTVIAPCTVHHMRMNARSRRTELCSAPLESSTKRQMACTPAPLARRSSAAVSRSSMPPYSWAYEPSSSDDSRTARCRPRTTTVDSEDEEHGHAEPEAPVEDGEDDEHPEDEQQPTGGRGDDSAEEVRDRRDVAVDALDQLSGCVTAMELVVEAEDVAGDAQAQLVGGVPRRDRRSTGDDDARTWVAMAMARKSDASRTISAAVAPSVARSTMRRITSGPASISAEPAPTSAPRTTQRRGVGSQQRQQGAPRATGTGPPWRPVSSPLVARGRTGLRCAAQNVAPMDAEVRADEVDAVEELVERGAAGRGDLDRRDVRRLLTCS